MKKCSVCGIEKTTDCFPKSQSNGRQSIHSYCFDCNRARAKEHYQKTKEASASRSYKKRYGISLEEYARMFCAQNGVCAICGKAESGTFKGSPKQMAVDHCHNSAVVRGLLCNGCNVGLGAFRDDPELLRLAAKYLEDNSE